MRFLFFICVAFIVNGCSILNLSHDKVNRHDKDNQDIEFDSYFAEALKQKILGSYFQSEDLLLKCSKLQPKNSAVFYELSIVYFSLGKLDVSLSAGLKAVQYDDTNEWYLFQVSKLYKLLGNTDSSLFFYKKIVKVKPDKCEYRLKLAQLYYENKDYKQSLGTLKKIEHKFGLIIELVLPRYKNYLALGNNKKCLETLIQATKKYPYEPRYYGLLAEHYATIGNKEQAFIYYKSLLKLDPYNENGHLSLIEFYRNVGKIREAIDLASKFISNSEFSVNSKIDLVSSFISDQSTFKYAMEEIKCLIDTMCLNYPDIIKLNFLIADYFVKMNDIDSALYEILKVKDKANSDEEFWERYFHLLGLKNDYSSIYKYSIEAQSYVIRSPVIYLYTGISAFRLKLFSEAVEILSEGLKYAVGTKSLEFNYYNYLGESFNALKEYSQSDFCFEKAIVLNPDNVFILNNYSYYLSVRNERLDRALLYSKKCIELNGGNFKFLDTYAWILFKLGKNTESLKVIERAYLMGGDKQSVILEHYIEILLALNQKEEAFKYYKLLKELGNDNLKLRSIFTEYELN